MKLLCHQLMRIITTKQARMWRKILVALGIMACASSCGSESGSTGPEVDPGNNAFTRSDVAVGDPNVSYGSTEFSPDWKYLIWGEYATDGTGNLVVWHCEVNPETGDLIPADGKGFRAFESTLWGRASAGRDAQGVNYVGMNRSGQLVLVRPTSATTGTVAILPTPADITRRAIYVSDAPEAPGQIGYVFWIKNENVAGSAGDTRNTWVELRYISLADPCVIRKKSLAPASERLSSGVNVCPLVF